MLGALGLGVLVAVTAYGCVILPRTQGRVTPIWLANAWLLAALLRSGTPRWTLLTTFAMAGNLVANLASGDPVSRAAVLALCNGVECLSIAGLLRQFCGERFDISQARHLGSLVGLAAFGSVLSAMGASLVLSFATHPGFMGQVAVWVGAHTLGLVTLTPVLLVLSPSARVPVDWEESWTLAVVALVSAVVLSMSGAPMLFAISAILTLPTWRMGLAGAVGGFVIVAAIGTVAVFTGHGPIMLAASSDRIIGLQIFLTISFLTVVPVGVARDNGEGLKARLRAALADARTAKVEAEQAAAVKTEFLANMSHELRTPLTSVVGFTHLACEQPDLSPLSRDYIGRVSDASRALLCAVNDILDFSKLEAGQVNLRPQPVSIAPLVSTALSLFTPQAAAKDLTLSLDDQTPVGLALSLDPDRLRQVLLNLVGNAVKFTAEGQVTLSAAYDAPAGCLVVTVADTGPGIAPDRLDRLFKRFSQVDGSLNRGHGGTGLGLAICKGIVEAMGGTIGAVSTPGQGSAFSLSIPAPRVDVEPARDTPRAPAVAQRLAGAGLRVLVTDDHPANRELVKLFLAAIGAKISEAEDGRAAVEAARRDAFDVILMDLRMPGMDGFAATSQIRATPGPNQNTPILAFTADAECVFDGRVEAAGFSGAVAKPVEPSQLMAAIETVVALNPAAAAEAERVVV